MRDKVLIPLRWLRSLWDHDRERASEEHAVINAYHATFTSPHGQTVLEDLARAYGQRTSFVPGDANVTCFREGQRDVYLRILVLIEKGNQPKQQEDSHA